jgi:class 3 adenylate cyclase
MSQTRIVVELDMVGYSDIARKREKDYGHPIAVAELNKEIQQFVDFALKEVSLDPGEVVKARNGDNAVIVFDDPIKAHLFAKAVHLHAKKYNDSHPEKLAQRWFRIGCASGPLHEEVKPDETEEISGIVIADAYRLEASARPGEFLIDEATYNALKDFLKADDPYLDPETAHGKRTEEFTNARRWQVIPRISLLELTAQNTDLERAVNQYFSNLDEIYKMIDKTYNYKLLHDFFQKLENELPLFRNIQNSLTATAFHDNYAQIIQYDQDTPFMKCISEIERILKKNDLGIEQLISQKWERKLESIRTNLAKAFDVDNNDDLSSPLTSIISALKDILYIHGITLLNQKLVESARKIEEAKLEALTKSLGDIRDLYSSLSNIHNPSQVDEMGQNIQDIKTINEKLTELLRVHDKLQFFDDEFRSLQSDLKSRDIPDGLDEKSKNQNNEQILIKWNDLYNDFIITFRSSDIPENIEAEKNLRTAAMNINQALIGINDSNKKLKQFDKNFAKLKSKVDLYFEYIDKNIIELIKTELITKFEALQKHDAVFDVS